MFSALIVETPTHTCDDAERAKTKDEFKVEPPQLLVTPGSSYRNHCPEILGLLYNPRPAPDRKTMLGLRNPKEAGLFSKRPVFCRCLEAWLEGQKIISRILGGQLGQKEAGFSSKRPVFVGSGSMVGQKNRVLGGQLRKKGAHLSSKRAVFCRSLERARGRRGDAGIPGTLGIVRPSRAVERTLCMHSPGSQPQARLGSPGGPVQRREKAGSCQPPALPRLCTGRPRNPKHARDCEAGLCTHRVLSQSQARPGSRGDAGSPQSQARPGSRGHAGFSQSQARPQFGRWLSAIPSTPGIARGRWVFERMLGLRNPKHVRGREGMQVLSQWLRLYCMTSMPTVLSALPRLNHVNNTFCIAFRCFFLLLKDRN